MCREWNTPGSAGRVPASFLVSLKDYEVIEWEGREEKKGKCNVKGREGNIPGLSPGFLSSPGCGVITLETKEQRHLQRP